MATNATIISSIRIGRSGQVNLPERWGFEFHFSSFLLEKLGPLSPRAVLEATIERSPGPYITFIPVIFHAGQTFRRMMHYLERNSGRDKPGPRRTNAREMGQEHPAECRSLFRPIDRPTNLISPRIFSDTSNACNFKNWTT